MTENILIVDDETDIRGLLAGLLEDEGYTTYQASDSRGVFDHVRTRRPHLVILDIWLHDSPLDGQQILTRLKKEYPTVPVVMISGHASVEAAVEAIKHGAYDFVEKPFKSDRLLTTVANALEAGHMRRELADLRARLDWNHPRELVCHSPAMRAVSETVNRVAPSASRVMITGPAGSGKETVARCIHALSPRAKHPFVIANCAALRPETLEDSLFGLQSFQGKIKAGLLEQADGGTLLLDEVADMPHESQGKIVRFLQDRSFTRVGGDEIVVTDSRILSSSNKALEGEMRAGRFREDLFFQLCVVPVSVPRLAERSEDIPDMAAQLMKQAVAHSGGGEDPRAFADDALAAMCAYSWPGNVRQLRNVIDWILIMAPGKDPIRADMLPAEITAHKEGTSTGEGAYLHLHLRQAREAFESRYLEAQMRRFDDNVTKVADCIGMERSALHRKLKSLGLWPKRATHMEEMT